MLLKTIIYFLIILGVYFIFLYISFNAYKNKEVKLFGLSILVLFSTGISYSFSFFLPFPPAIKKTTETIKSRTMYTDYLRVETIEGTRLKVYSLSKANKISTSKVLVIRRSNNLFNTYLFEEVVGYK